jgi:hypothetical protein
MKVIPTAVYTFAAFMAATGVYAVGNVSIDETRTRSANSVAASPMERALVALPDSAYLPYSEPELPASPLGCYWVRLAVYDSEHRVVGWRGDPIGKCP